MDYYQYFGSCAGNRDLVFDYTLSLFNEKPIKILEIGTIRDLSLPARASDGWSSFHFLRYINKNYGSLDICDISKAALDNISILNNYKQDKHIDINFNLGEGINFINKDYDLIYLDGGDSLDEMVDELGKIDLTKQVVLCDDFHTKGQKVKEIYKNHLLFKWVDNQHEMALFHKNINGGTIVLNQIQ
jgi:hypothetical protein